MEIRLYPDPILRIKSSEINKIDKTIKRIIKDMKNTMIIENGIGLAANQVGVAKRLIILDFFEKRVAMLNPKLIKTMGYNESALEGCLSFPELQVNIERSLKIKIAYLDEDGNNQEEILTDIFARAFQHELDHLNGRLIIDYLNPSKQLDYNFDIIKKGE